MFIFGLSCILSTGVVGGNDFNGVFSWFTLLSMVALHISCLAKGGKSHILMTIFYII